MGWRGTDRCRSVDQQSIKWHIRSWEVGSGTWKAEKWMEGQIIRSTKAYQWEVEEYGRMIRER